MGEEPADPLPFLVEGGIPVSVVGWVMLLILEMESPFKDC